MRRKSTPSDVEMSKTEFRGFHLGFLAAILDWHWVHACSLYQSFGTFMTKWTVDTPIVIFYHFFTMPTGSSYLQIIPLILNQFWLDLVHTYKIHFWISLVICVVFKFQYFWSYSGKTQLFSLQRGSNHGPLTLIGRAV